MSTAFTLDLETGFRGLLEAGGVSPGLSRLIWLPLPMQQRCLTKEHENDKCCYALA